MRDLLKSKKAKTRKLRELSKTELLTSIETSNAFDGSYTFTLMVPPMNGLGYGTLEINKGIVTISKDSKGMVAPKYDSFEGRIDKNGDIVASFYFNPCSHCGFEDKSVVFKGNIDKLKLSGMYDDIQVYFYLAKK